jgi:SAM-dependent methyltransferase
MINKKNKKFYSGLENFDVVEKNAENSGLSGCIDLDVIMNNVNIKRSKIILEVGAGIGRVISGLLDRGYSNRIIGVERNIDFIDNLKSTFKANKNVEIVNIDLLEDKVPMADFGLHLWAGFAEFGLNEQLRLLKNVYYSVSSGYIIDLPLEGVKTNAKKIMGRKQIVVLQGGIQLETYVSSQGEIYQFSKTAGFKETKAVFYTPVEGRERVLYFLLKNK